MRGGRTSSGQIIARADSILTLTGLHKQLRCVSDILSGSSAGGQEVCRKSTTVEYRVGLTSFVSQSVRDKLDRVVSTRYCSSMCDIRWETVRCWQDQVFARRRDCALYSRVSFASPYCSLREDTVLTTDIYFQTIRSIVRY